VETINSCGPAHRANSGDAMDAMEARIPSVSLNDAFARFLREIVRFLAILEGLCCRKNSANLSSNGEEKLICIYAR